MFALQYDLVSLQARELLEVFLPHMSDGELKQRFESWDCRYDNDSHEASLFQRLYAEIIMQVYGQEEIMGWVLDNDFHEALEVKASEEKWDGPWLCSLTMNRMMELADLDGDILEAIYELFGWAEKEHKPATTEALLKKKRNRSV